MEAFVNFIKDYWSYIASALIIVIQVVILIIKRRKPEILSDGILSVIEETIAAAEKYYGAGHGDEKLRYVIQAVILQFPKVSVDAIKSRVEYLLTLPQKKGVK